MHASSVLRASLDLLGEALFPSRCVACDARVAPHALFCGVCTLSVDAAPRGLAIAPFAYGGAVSVAVKRFKYARRSDLAVRLGRAVGACVARRLGTGCVDVVIAVPLHAQRRAERGFEQAELLAREVATILATERVPGALRRVRPTRVQASLAREERRINVDGAFVVCDPSRLRGLRVLLVDDVVTTGATLAAAASALRNAGAASVRAAAFAVRDDEEGP